LRFLADANVSQRMVEFLLSEGHQVRSVNTMPPSTPDVEVLREAVRAAEILLTADTDFGELVFLHRLDARGVVLCRLPSLNEAERTCRIAEAWPEIMKRLPGFFITVTERQIRARPID
jgi:predicted nuclease of predicted toxin-antitoxin system